MDSSTSSASEHSRKGKSVVRRPAFVAGFLLAFGVIGNAAWDLGKGIYGSREDIAAVWNGKPLAEVWRANTDQFKGKMYFAFDDGNGKAVVYSATLHGNETLTGEIEDVVHNTKGVITGHRRADGIAFEWASKDPSRPGFGTAMLRAYTSASESDPLVYAGTATYHNCMCKDGSTTHHGPIETTQMLLTANPVPSDALKTLFFRDGPHKVGVYPADLQKLSAAEVTGPTVTQR